MQRKGRKRKPFTEEHKRKLSEKAKERFVKNPESNPFFNNPIWLGRKHTQESIEKMKRNRTGLCLNNKNACKNK
jgi:hypothetical protein